MKRIALLFLFMMMVGFVSAFSWIESETVAYYQFDRSSGTVFDEKNTHPATNGGANRGVEGKLNYSFEYDNTAAKFVNITTNPLFGIGGADFSINVWFNPGNMNGTQNILDLGRDAAGGTDAYFSIVTDSSNDTRVLAYQNGAFSINSIVGAVTEGNWYMATLVRDGTTLRGYLDGVSTLNISMSGSYDGLFIDLGYIGDTTSTTVRNYWDGLIDDMGFWNVSLNVSEVQSLHNSGRGLFYDEQYGEPFSELTSPANNTEVLVGSNDINVSSEGLSLVNVSLYLNGALDETINISGNTNTSTFTTSFSEGEQTLIFQTCASDKCVNSSAYTLTASKHLLNSITFNGTAYETAIETFSINITTNGTAPSNAKLQYNSTEYNANVYDQGNNVYIINSSITLSETNIFNNSFYFDWDFNGGSDNSNTYYQEVQAINFSYCTDASNYLNFTFIDEETSNFMNASITSSTFVYWIDDSTVNKTYTYTNSSETPSYAFCLNVSTEKVYVDMVVQYEANGYPQRVYEPDTIRLNSSGHNHSLYLLATSGNQFVTIQFINSAEQTITGVFVTATRSIGGEEVVVSQGTSDASGTVTFFLNPDFTHTFTYEADGYDTLEQSFAPTQTEYTVTLETSADTSQDYIQGISYSVLPANITLINDTTYTFGFEINSTIWVLDSWGFVLRDENGTTIQSNTSTANSGGSLYFNYDVGSNQEIELEYFWEVNDTYINGSRTWYILSGQGTEWSLLVAFNNTRNTLQGGLFGATPFTVAIISFLVIFLFVGIMSWKFGITSPAAISSMTFILVAIFDVGLGLFGDFKLGGAVPNLPTIFVGLVTIGMFIREANR